MKIKITLTVRNILKYTLVSLLLLTFTFCQNLDEEFISINKTKVTKDSKVVSLMIDVAKNGISFVSAKSDDNQQCASFLYPITFDVFFGDNPVSSVMTINSDAELLDFLMTLTGNTGFYINFPIYLLDANGVEVIINDLFEFENALQTAIEICTGGDDDSDDDNDNDDDDDDDSDDDDDDDDSDDDDDDNDDDDDDSDDDDDDNDDDDDSDDDDDDSDDDDDDSDDDDDDDSDGDDDDNDDDDGGRLG